MSDAKVQSVKVSVDTKVEQIIECDKAGVKLQFECERGRFQELKPEIVKSLSSANQERYAMAREMFLEQPTDAWEDEVAALVNSQPTYANATERLTVLNKDPNFEYEFAAADGIQNEMARGWEVVNGGVKTGQNPSGKGITKTMSNGKPELVLMRIPKVKHEQLMAKHHEGIEGFMNGTTAEQAAKVGRGMGGSLEPEVTTSRN